MRSMMRKWRPIRCMSRGPHDGVSDSMPTPEVTAVQRNADGTYTHGGRGVSRLCHGPSIHPHRDRQTGIGRHVPLRVQYAPALAGQYTAALYEPYMPNA